MKKKPWTQSRWRLFKLAAWRGARNPLKYKARGNALVGRKLHPKTKRMRNEYECSSCKGTFPVTGVSVDHIETVVPLDWTSEDWDWNVIDKRLFCPLDGLQVLCKQCHKEKTNEENKERRENRNRQNQGS